MLMAVSPSRGIASSTTDRHVSLRSGPCHSAHALLQYPWPSRTYRTLRRGRRQVGRAHRRIGSLASWRLLGIGVTIFGPPADVKPSDMTTPRNHSYRVGSSLEVKGPGCFVSSRSGSSRLLSRVDERVVRPENSSPRS